MKTAPTIQRTLLATLMVFATAAIGLQPLVFSSSSSCECNAVETGDVQSAATESSCCSEPVQAASEHSCCSAKPPASAKPTTKKGCCCNPAATVCKCVDCRCSIGDEDSIPASPAIPTNETTEIVSPLLICAAPFVGHPRETGKQRFSNPRSALEFAALSSQELCVLLSRFTC